MEAPPRPAPPSWSALEDCGDSFENVLALLPPADVAACRLVSRAWRRQVSVLLQHLQPAAGTPPGAVAAAFPHLARLQLTATSTGRSSSRGGGGGDEASALPPLWPLPQLRRLRRLKLQGLPAEPGSLLDCAELLPLASALAFDDLEAACLELRNASALQQLAQLTRLHLAGPRLGDWRGSLPALLAPLRRLAHLHFACVDSSAAGGSSSDCGEEEPGDEPGPFGSAGQLAGLRRLTTLVTLELACPDGASDAACWEVAAGPLPRLRRLSISHSASFGQAAPAVSDAGLELVCRRLGGQLTSLTLAGHARITDAGVAHLAQLRLLQHLELRLGGTDDWPWQPEVTDEGLQAVAALTQLQSLHLGGACGLGERTCAALARRLPGLTSLQLTDCPSLSDGALFRLAPLVPGLLRLGLCGCTGVTDIALAGVLRGATRLARLEMAGCHRNITGVGLRVLGGLRRLRHLNLSGCDAITDDEIDALLPAMGSLEHLDLSDCCVTDGACALLAAHAPRLQWLSLEHCCGVSNRGLLALAAGLPRLGELRLCGSGVGEGAVAQLRRTPRGRRLRIGLYKHCWWMAAEGDALAL